MIGEIKLRHLYDQTFLLRDFVRFAGPNRAVSDISTVDLQNYRKKLIKTGIERNLPLWPETIQVLKEIQIVISHIRDAISMGVLLAGILVCC